MGGCVGGWGLGVGGVGHAAEQAVLCWLSSCSRPPLGHTALLQERAGSSCCELLLRAPAASAALQAAPPSGQARQCCCSTLNGMASAACPVQLGLPLWRAGRCWQGPNVCTPALPAGACCLAHQRKMDLALPPASCRAPAHTSVHFCRPQKTTAQKHTCSCSHSVVLPQPCGAEMPSTSGPAAPLALRCCSWRRHQKKMGR